MSEKVQIFEATKKAASKARDALEALRTAQHAAVDRYQAARRLEEELLAQEHQRQLAIEKAREEAELARELAEENARQEAEERGEAAGDAVAAPAAAEEAKQPEAASDKAPETAEAPVAQPEAGEEKAARQEPVTQPAPQPEPEVKAEAAPEKPVEAQAGTEQKAPESQAEKPAAKAEPVRAAKPGDRVPMPPRPEIKPAGPQRPLKPGDRVAMPPRPVIRPAGEQRPIRPQQGGAAAGRTGARPGGGATSARPGGPRMQGGFGGTRRGAKPELSPPVEKERVSNYDPNKSSYQRVYDNDKKEKTKRDIFRQTLAQTGGEDEGRFRRVKRNNKQAAPRPAPIKIESAVITTDQVMIKDLAEKIGKPASEIIKKLFLLGTMVTINQEIDFDTAELIAADFGVTLTHKPEKTFEEVLIEEDRTDSEEELIVRPPVVTVMGHVDHGKTSILDAIRRAHVAEGEAGGITQHIGAYVVEIGGRAITFLDTPGHEAFTAMRARGAQVTDVAVLVVAADDGIMPQTVEAIDHAKAANVPIIVAVNKIDKPGADVNRVMQMLTEHNLVPEAWGGDTVIAPVSALTGEGIDNLLEMILLVADVQDLKANPNRLAKGTIIEAQLDKGRGPVATVLVQNGTLRVGDTVVAGTAYGRVRAMMNDKGERVQQAGPSVPVEVLGFGEVPAAGDIMYAVEEDRLSRQVAEERRAKQRDQLLKTQSRASLDDLFTRISEGNVKELNLIIKADVQG
nr:translation initiation factor IF-2 [bacterium]